MGLVPVISTVWTAVVLCTAALYIYRTSLTRDEEDQIFLDDSFEHEKIAQAAIIAKVARVEPLVRLARWLAIGMTVIVLAYYVYDICVQLHLI